MKVFLAFAFLIAGISATSIPHIPSFFMDERLISDQIESAIEDASQAIKDAGLDPFHIERESCGYTLPVPALFNYEAVIEDILSTGLSNIVTHRVFISIFFSRLDIEIELPLIQFSAGSARANSEVFSNKLDFSASGAIDVVSIFVKGEVHFNIHVISGITLRSVTIDLTLEDINSDARMVVRARTGPMISMISLENSFLPPSRNIIKKSTNFWSSFYLISSKKIFQP